MKIVKIPNILFCLLFTFASHSSICLSAPNPIAESQKLQDLMLWKISEDLKLNLKQEQALQEVVRKLRTDKQSLILEQNELLKDVEKLKTDKQATDWLLRYRKNQKKIQDLAVLELDHLGYRLGNLKTAQYVKLRNELSEKVKNLVMQNEGEKK